MTQLSFWCKLYFWLPSSFKNGYTQNMVKYTGKTGQPATITSLCQKQTSTNHLKQNQFGIKAVPNWSKLICFWGPPLNAFVYIYNCPHAEKPDSVSISLVNHSSTLVEGREYQLQCEVQNVAPVQYLVLRWYRGKTEVYNHSFSELSPATPVQVSSTLPIVPNRADNGAQYRCEAQLELGAEGPQPPPTVQSEVLNIAVQCR